MTSDWIEKKRKILTKYKEGRDIDPEDRKAIDELCLIGLMHRGISLKRQKVNAKITYDGRKILEALMS